MAQFHPAWLAHERERWRRHDWHRYVRPDADVNPNRYVRPQYAQLAQPADPRQQAAGQDEMTPEELAAYCSELLDIKALVAELQWPLALRRFARKYRPDQARDDRGRWVDEGGGQPTAIETVDQSLQSRLAGVIVRICTAGSRSLSTDQWGNKSHWVIYDCIGERSFRQSGPGHRFPGFVLDPFR
jgi:hypothetical protein